MKQPPSVAVLPVGGCWLVATIPAASPVMLSQRWPALKMVTPCCLFLHYQVMTALLEIGDNAYMWQAFVHASGRGVAPVPVSCLVTVVAPSQLPVSVQFLALAACRICMS